MRKLLLACAAFIGIAAAAPLAHADDLAPLKIGVLNDMNGIFSNDQGPGSVIAAQLAIDDFGKLVHRKIELISGDHMNKPDVGSALTRQWLDDGVQLILDVPGSAIALDVASQVRAKNKVFIGSGAGASELTGSKCTPNTVHWDYDTYEVGAALGHALTAQGKKSFFFITADYVFGWDMEKNAIAAIKEDGGTVKGAVRAPLGTSDFSSYLLQAQQSGAQVLFLANPGMDTVNSLKQAAEFGLNKTMLVANPITNPGQVHSIGLADTQGLEVVTPFYWDENDGTRAFSRRFAEKDTRHRMPNDMQAGVYAGLEHYLKAIAAGANPDDGAAVVAKMKAIPTDDALFGKGTIRADGRKMHPVFLYQVKTPAESKGEWDVFKQVGVVPADKAFRPMSEGGCPLVANK